LIVEAAAGRDEAQLRALDYPADGGLLALVGPPGTGKSATLVRRAAHLAREGAPVWLTAAAGTGVDRLRAALGEAEAARVRCASFGAVALEILQAARPLERFEPIDEVRAAEHFASAGAGLFSLDWAELASAEIDPEITGLRAPQHFSAAAFRLIRKLRSALISPADFRTQALRGANSFFGRRPNFAATDLISDTPLKYRDSLHVESGELALQYEREIDLVKIVTRLYESYLETLVAHGCLTEIDALCEATLLLRDRPAAGAQARERFPALLADDAQDLLPVHLAFVQAVYGAEMRGVTVAGDMRQATRTFAGTRGEAAFEGAAETIVFAAQHRCDPQILAFAERALDRADRTGPSAPEPRGESVDMYRGDTQQDEANFVAATVAGALARGDAAGSIAVILRNLRCAGPYVEALLARDVDVDLAGTASLYDQPAAADALAALWTVADPFRHDYLLRALEGPWMRLSDASIAALCAEPDRAQPPLFELPEEEDGEIRRRDGRKELRLGYNFARGDADSTLSEEARERVAALRAARERWLLAARRLPLGRLARMILEGTVFASLDPGARGRYGAAIAERLLDEIDAFAARDPLATLEDFLHHAENVAGGAADLLQIAPHRPGCVRVLDVEFAKGLEFDTVFVVDVRAGALPRYYVPDAFLFTPYFGMIPKENVGDGARAARTAKFTYAMFRSKARQRYNAAERRAFYCAATRARRRLYVSASGRATRGTNTPEIFEELRESLPRS
jgi:superfamily I DNA/RNA helicase